MAIHIDESIPYMRTHPKRKRIVSCQAHWKWAGFTKSTSHWRLLQCTKLVQTINLWLKLIYVVSPTYYLGSMEHHGWSMVDVIVLCSSWSFLPCQHFDLKYLRTEKTKNSGRFRTNTLCLQKRINVGHRCFCS